MTNYVLRGLYTMRAYNTAPPGVDLDEVCWACVKVGETPDKAYHSIRLNLPSSWIKNRTLKSGETIMSGTTVNSTAPVYPKQYFVYTIVEPNQEPEPGEDEVSAIHLLIKAPSCDPTNIEVVVKNVIITFAPSGVIMREIEDAECSQFFKSPNLIIMNQINIPFAANTAQQMAGIFSAYYGDNDAHPVKGWLWTSINHRTIEVHVTTYNDPSSESAISKTEGYVIGVNDDIGQPYFAESSKVSGIDERLGDVQTTLQSGSFISR